MTKTLSPAKRDSVDMAIIDAPTLPLVRTAASRLTRALATPLVPTDYLNLFNPLLSPSQLRAKVIEVRPETRDATTLVLRPGRGWHSYRAGQYIRIGADIDGVRHWRAYSLTSPPRTDGCISITVKAIPDGLVSNYLVRRARPGLTLQLDQAAGEFVLPEVRPAKTLFITAGSGITPVMGMLRHSLESLTDVVLIHSAPTPDDVIFGGELRKLAQATQLRLIECHTDIDGMLTPAQLDDLVPDLIERETWACGPTGLLDALEARWDADGISDQLHTERFRPTIVVAGDGGTVVFRRSDVTIASDAATPILDAGEQAGVLMPSGCRMGICFGCVVPLREGAVRDLRTGELTTAAEGDGVAIQTCISAAAGDCHIDL
jgi:stearoyl-CoA 9-desaturase NADPH oxidoreductase